MKYTAILIIVTTLLLVPTTAQASCSGFVDCLFGFTERTEVRQAEATERARIEAQRAEEVARIQAEADYRIRQADAEVERVKQMQYQTEAQRDIAVAEAQRRAEEYKAMIAGLTMERVAGIQSNADTQIQSLQSAAAIHIAGITETGATERYRIIGGWTFAIAAIILVAWLVNAYYRHVSAVRVLPPGRRPALPRERRQIGPGYGYEIVTQEEEHAIDTWRAD